MTTTIDKSFELPVYSPVCTLCRHLTDIVNRRCEAFSDRTPAEIWRGDNDHRELYRSDLGIQFEPIST